MGKTTIQRFFSLFLVPIRRSPEFCFFMYTLFMTSAVCTVNYRWKQELYDYAWGEAWLWVYASALILAVLPAVVRRIVRPVFYIVAYTVTIADVYCFVKFESPLNPSILMLVGETDPREAGEFFTAYLTPDILMSNVGWTVLVLLLHIVWTILRRFGLPCRLLRPSLHNPLPSGLLPSAAGIAVIVSLVSSCILSWQNLRAMHTLMTLPTIGSVEHKLTEKDCGRQFMSMYRMAFSVYANHLTARQVTVLKRVAEDVRVDSCSFRSPEIVFIIGEAYNKRHSQMYGYERPTTPRQLELYRRGELIPFRDVVSPWNLTSYVFKLMMSTYTVGDEGDWCDYPLFCEVFRNAGYHVTFLTNEFLPQAKQQVFDFSGGFFLNDPDLSAKQFDDRNHKLHIFDEDLISDYRIIQEEHRLTGDTLHKGRLTIFHLIGQHQDYRIRCPNSRKRFTLADYADRTDLVKPRWRRNLCNYDNATLYNDSIVTAITDLFRDKDAIVIYMPDHGEEVHSRELPHFSGRMHSTKIVKRLAREEFEIPFWIWTSRRYRQNHPDVMDAIRKAALLPYMTDAIPHMLFSLAGIHCPYYRPDLDILSPSYNPKRTRMLKRQTDYDELMGGDTIPQPRASSGKSDYWLAR